MWKNGKKKKKQTNKNWTKSVPQAQGSERELFVRKTNSAIDLFGRRSFVFLFSVIFPIMRKPSFKFFLSFTLTVEFCDFRFGTLLSSTD